MAYDNFISRGDAGATIPEEVSNALLSGVEQESIALQIFPKIRMGNQQTRMPVLSLLPAVYWGTGDTSAYQNTEANWDNKYLDAAELYAVVALPNKLIDDESIDLWSQIEGPLKAKMAQAIDAAIFLDINKPTQWVNTAAIVTENLARSNTFAQQTAAASGGIAEDINQTFALVEADGFPVNFAVAPVTFKSKLRSARDTTGQKLMDVQNVNVDGATITQTYIDGVPIYFGIDGLWTTGLSKPQMVCGDRRQGVFGLRSDMQARFLDQAVFTDADGKVTLNLAQQDMTALKLTFRVAYQTANIINLQNTNNATRWPFATLLTAAS